MLLDPLAYAVEMKAVPALAVADLAVCLVIKLALNARVLQVFLARSAHAVVFRDLVPENSLFLRNCNLHYEMTVIVHKDTYFC